MIQCSFTIIEFKVAHLRISNDRTFSRSNGLGCWPRLDLLGIVFTFHIINGELFQMSVTRVIMNNIIMIKLG